MKLFIVNETYTDFDNYPSCDTKLFKTEPEQMDYFKKRVQFYLDDKQYEVTTDDGYMLATYDDDGQVIVIECIEEEV